MICVCFHAFNIPMVFTADIKDVWFRIIPEIAIKQLHAVFCDEYQVYHQEVFVMTSVLI